MKNLPFDHLNGSPNNSKTRILSLCFDEKLRTSAKKEKHSTKIPPYTYEGKINNKVEKNFGVF